MDSMYKPSEWMNTPIQDNLLEMFFKDSPIIIDWDFKNTQRIEYQNKRPKQLVLGAWAGPKQCITHLMHEMAHLVEIDDKRILKYGWGLKTPEEYIPGRYGHFASMPVTYQPSLRECRVIAMQWQLQNYLGIEESPRDAISSLEYMPDWCNIPHLPYNEKYTNGAQVKESRLNFLERHMLQYAVEKYTFNFFMKEWIRKNDLLRNRLRRLK